MGGTPTHWRTAEGDADRNPEFIDVWLNEFDAISPWTIGRYKTEEEAEAFCEHKMRADADLITRRNEDSRSLRRIDYIPVVFPGGSVSLVYPSLAFLGLTYNLGFPFVRREVGV